MTLDLGTLVGYLELDGDKFDSSIDAMPDKLKSSGAVTGVAGLQDTQTGLDQRMAGLRAMRSEYPYSQTSLSSPSIPGISSAVSGRLTSG